LGRINMVTHDKYIRSRQSGYTLIELLLYVALIGILLTAVVGFFTMTADARVKNQTINEVNDQGVFAIDTITQSLRNATSITAPSTGASGGQLTIVMPTSAISPTIFNLSGTTLQIKEGTNTAVSLTNSKVQIIAFSVKNLSRPSTPGIAQISLTLARVNGSGRNEYEYTKTFTASVAIRP
jgi:prepilin-type N-terminal cleavage/methylation domain-containing protein